MTKEECLIVLDQFVDSYKNALQRAQVTADKKAVIKAVDLLLDSYALLKFQPNYERKQWSRND